MANTASTRIRTAEDIHLVRTPSDYRISHEKAIGRLRLRGLNVAVHPGPDAQAVIITRGIAAVSCPCGGVEAASKDWDEARCFCCGSVYGRLQWPAAWDEICDVLLARPFDNMRNWGALSEPGVIDRTESVADLKAQNIAHGDPESSREGGAS